MIIITKASAATRPVTVEQIAMAILRRRLRFINSWWYQNCCIPLTTITKVISYHISNQTSNKLDKQMKPVTVHQFIAVGLIGLVLFVNCATFVSATSKSSIRSITNSDGNDPRRPNNNWFEFQKQTLNRGSQSQAPPQELSNIFSQLGIFIQSRQRNASELAGNIFFKYYNT